MIVSNETFGELGLFLQPFWFLAAQILGELLTELPTGLPIA